MVPARPIARGTALAALLIATACNPFGGGDEAPTTTAPPPSTQPPSRVGLSADGVLRVGALIPLTGEMARFGPGMQAAIELAVDEINDAGGVLGQDVELVIQDSQSTAEQASAATQQLIDTSNVDVIIGPGSTLELIPPVVEQASNAERVLCTPSASSALLGTLDEKGLFFSMTPRRDGAGGVVARLLAERAQDHITVVRRDDETTANLGDRLQLEVKTEFAGVPYEVTDIVVTPGTPDPTEVPTAVPTTAGETETRDPNGPLSTEDAANAVLAASPEAVVLLMTPAEAAPVLRGLFDAGVLPSQGGPIAVYVTDGLATEDLALAVDAEKPALLNGVEGIRPDVQRLDAESNSDGFTARLRAETGLRTEEVDQTKEAYDCAVLTILSAVGGDEPAVMAERLPGLTRDGEPCAAIVACRDAIAAGQDIAYSAVTGVIWTGEGDPTEGHFEHFRFADRGQIESIDFWLVTYEADRVGVTPGVTPPIPAPRAPASAPAGSGKSTTTITRSPSATTTTSTPATPATTTSTTGGAPG